MLARQGAGLWAGHARRTRAGRDRDRPGRGSDRAPARVTTRSHLRFAGALGVGAVAVLGVLQSAIGAFNPRPIVLVLIVAAVFFAGLWAQRIASRRAARTAAAARATQLREILGVWPPEVLPDVDGLRLGVYPRRRDTSATGLMSRGRSTSRCATLCRRAASRSSTARRGRASHAPRSRRSLRRGPGRGCSRRAVGARSPTSWRSIRRSTSANVDTIVWLDGLERFAGTMDSLSLDGLMDLAHESTVVVTVRDSDWTRLAPAATVAKRRAPSPRRLARSSCRRR